MTDQKSAKADPPNKIDPKGPIDLPLLVSKTSDGVFYQLHLAHAKTNFGIQTSDLIAQTSPHSKEIITIAILGSAGSLGTYISKDTLGSFSCLEGLATHFVMRPADLYDVASEEEYVGQELKTHLDLDIGSFQSEKDYQDALDRISVDAVSIEAWRFNQLSALGRTVLQNRLAIKSVAAAKEDETIGDWFGSAEGFQALRQRQNYAFLIARLISEYFMRIEVEPLAQKGFNFEGAQEKRTTLSGQSSKSNKQARIEAMLGCMEELLNQNPALARQSIKSVAALAVQDAAMIAPQLWRQGKGSCENYLREAQVDLRYKERFDRLVGRFMGHH